MVAFVRKNQKKTQNRSKHPQKHHKYTQKTHKSIQKCSKKPINTITKLKNRAPDRQEHDLCNQKRPRPGCQKSKKKP
jgi:hypothetical protein